MRLTMALAGLFLFLSAGIASAQDIFRPITTYNLQVTSASASITTAIQPYVSVIRILSTVVGHVAVGATPLTATTADMYVAAGEEYWIAVRGGEYVAAIRASGDGNLYITQMTK